jgi:hypothetical protein
MLRGSRIAFEGKWAEDVKKRVAFLVSLGAEIVFNPALATVVVHKETMKDQDGLPVTCRSRTIHVTEQWLDELETSGGKIVRPRNLACEYDAKTRVWMHLFFDSMSNV